MGLEEVRIGYVDGGPVLAGADVLEALHRLVVVRVVALVLRVVRRVAIRIVGQPEQIRGNAILLQALHILQWNNPAQILVVDVNHFGFGEVPRRKEGALGAGYARAGLLAPVRQVIHAIERINVAELVHALHARFDGGHLGERAIPAQEQTHLLHGSHVLRVKPVGQTHQGIVVAKGQLFGGDVDEGLEFGRC